MDPLTPLKSRKKLFSTLALALLCLSRLSPSYALPNTDIVFVGQIPNPTDFATANAVFGNHLATVESVVRGGDLFIRYRSGRVRNITREAGFGKSGFQGAGSIAVRDPSVSWDGKKVLFSMVVGSHTEQYRWDSFRWQLYEATGLGEDEVPVVSKVPFQPTEFNNVSPIYAPDDAIIFTSDRPRNGAPHLYPQRDEYESQPTNTGLWRLDPSTGALRLLDHAPSGAFEPFADSFGRIVYTRWDHLQRDQQADDTDDYGAFNYASESPSALRLKSKTELFPEPRVRSLITDGRTNRHDFNHFFPWMINPDGTGHETINHIGRHELHGYFDRAFNDDDNLEEHYGGQGPSYQQEIGNFLQIHEDPAHRGRYFGIDAPEFGTHAAGQVITLQGDPARSADDMPLEYVTHRSTARPDAENISPEHSGFYRDPLPLREGTVVVAHTADKREDDNTGTVEQPLSRYSFRLKMLVQKGASRHAGDPLTNGIEAKVSYFTPDVLATYSGLLWELQPVELIARPRPVAHISTLETPEFGVFQKESMNVERLQRELADRNLALIVMRNVTSRDKADLQQPFNLRIPGGATESIKRTGKTYDVSFLQIFQGDQIRGYGGTESPEKGRRIIPNLLHDGSAANPAVEGAPPSAIRISEDGSVAAIVPAKRALTWQLTDPTGQPVVRERYWLTFQPGEIRTCGGCHGANSRDQLNRPPPTNAPQALGELLAYLKTHPLPPSEEDGQEPPVLKRYSLSVRGASGKVLRAGEKASLRISVSPPSQEKISIQLRINDRRCRQGTAAVTTDSSSRRTIRGRIPSLSRKGVLLSFLLRRGNRTVAEERRIVSLKSQPHRRGARLTSREFGALCQSLEAFR